MATLLVHAALVAALVVVTGEVDQTGSDDEIPVEIVAGIPRSVPARAAVEHPIAAAQASAATTVETSPAVPEATAEPPPAEAATVSALPTDSAQAAAASGSVTPAQPAASAPVSATSPPAGEAEVVPPSTAAATAATRPEIVAERRTADMTPANATPVSPAPPLALTAPLDAEPVPPTVAADTLPPAVSAATAEATPAEALQASTAVPPNRGARPAPATVRPAPITGRPSIAAIPQPQRAQPPVVDAKAGRQRLREAAAQEARADRARAAEAARRADERRQAQRGGPPALEPARAAAVPASASTSASSEDIAAYGREVVGRIAAMKRYPEDARSRGAQGTVVVAFSLGSAGQVAAATVSRSSGDAGLDAEAVSTVRRAGPFGPPPHGSPRAFSVPLRYRM